MSIMLILEFHHNDWLLISWKILPIRCSQSLLKVDTSDRRGTIIRLITMSLHIDWNPPVCSVFHNGIKHVGLTYNNIVENMYCLLSIVLIVIINIYSRHFITPIFVKFSRKDFAIFSNLPL